MEVTAPPRGERGTEEPDAVPEITGPAVTGQGEGAPEVEEAAGPKREEMEE